MPTARPRKRAPIDADRFARALAEWMANHSLTQTEAAERLGISQARISAWLLTSGVPSGPTADRVLPLMKLTLADVARMPTASAFPPSVVLIPRSTADADAADATAADPYPAAELERFTGLKPSRFLSAVVVGDSNVPVLRPGDHVIYDPRPTISDHGLYVLEVDGERVVKFVQRLAGGALALISANARYGTETLAPVAGSPDTYRSDLSPFTARLVVVGKVVWYPTLA